MNQDEINLLKQELRDYIDKNCIFRCNPTKLYSESVPIGRIPSNGPSETNNSMLFMLRRLTHDSKMLSYVSAIFLNDILEKIQLKEEYPIIQLCGLETGSIPIMTGIQQYAARFKISVNCFSIRKERKSYGLFHFIDGIPTDAPVIVIDDLFNSGSSMYRCVDTCFYELKLIPAKNFYSIITMRPQLVSDFSYKEHKSKVHSLFSKFEFDMTYSSEKYWLPKDCDRSYNKRPEYK